MRARGDVLVSGLGALLLVVFASLGGCVRSNLRHVDDGDDALRRGQLEQAERAYARALAGDPDLDQEERDAWVVAKVEAGRAGIELARVRLARPWTNLSGTPAAILAQLHTTGDRVRALGGDAKVEAAITEAMNGIASTALAALPGSKLAPWAQLREARALAPFPELSPATLVPVATLQGDAREVHATAAATAAPLARRVHQAVGAWIDEAALPAARELAAPYARGVAVTLAGPRAQDCAALAPLAALPAPGAQGTLEVSIEVTRCDAEVQVARAERTATWSEQVLVRVDRKPVFQTMCQDTYTEVRECFGNPLTCYSGKLVKTGASCSTVQVGESEIPIYRTESRSGMRPVDTQTGRYVVELTWTARRGGQTWSGAVRRADTAGGERGDAYAVLPAFSESWTAAEATFASAGTELTTALRERFTAETAADRAAAVARAVQVAATVGASPEAADAAWVEVALLGGEAGGRWPAWGLASADLVRAFDAQPGGAATRLALGATRTFALPARPRMSATQRTALESRLVPTLGATIWIDVHAGMSSVPEVPAPMGPDPLAGTSAAVVGFRVGHRGLSSSRRSTDGLGFVDDVAGEMHAGIVYAQPESAIGTSQLGFAATYTAAVGFRRIGVLGLFGGVRGAASWTQFGTSSGTHAAVTPVGRLELWLGRATVVVDAMARTLAGGRHEALAIHLGRIRQDGPGVKLTRFLTIRADRKVLDATVQLPYEVDGDISPELDIGDLAITTVTASYGFGF